MVAPLLLLPDLQRLKSSTSNVVVYFEISLNLVQQVQEHRIIVSNFVWMSRAVSVSKYFRALFHSLVSEKVKDAYQLSVSPFA